ncbi:MAG: hypothetical protein ACE5KI_01230, partial [Dehalococcoidia bacterium]
GAQAAERDNVQTAIDTLMADTASTTVTALEGATDTSTNDFGATGTLDLTGYLRETTTTYFYCWDTGGLVKSLDAAATLDCTDTN